MMRLPSPYRTMYQSAPLEVRRLAVLFACVAGLLAGPAVLHAEPTDSAEFRQRIQPLLVQYCYDCHGNGEKNGQVALDELKSDDHLLRNPELWSKVLQNVRANIMPPQNHERPDNDEKKLLAKWIKYQALGINPDDPDPGRVTLRRLNRVEYRNTIRDLMGFDYRANEEFSADDTGYGFDNIGDVLSVSPLLLEKYLKAADAIVAGAVPLVAKSVAERTIAGAEFRAADGKFSPPRFTFYKEAQVENKLRIRRAGSYRIALELAVAGQFEFDPGRCEVIFKIDGEELLKKEFPWESNKKFPFEFPRELAAGEHPLTLEIRPLTDPSMRINNLDLLLNGVKLIGPTEKQFQVAARNYDRFFHQEEPPDDAAERRSYAREILSRFATKAFRRPADEETIDRLLSIAETEYSHPGKRFEDGIARAMVAVLASPRFLFRVEEADPNHAGSGHPLVDEYALASRLSYFLWSSMPDKELIDLAEKGELRKNLSAQVQRMLKDSRCEALVQNFVGQWLQVRDVEGFAVDDRAIAAREDEELRKLIERAQAAENELDRRALFRQLRNRPRTELTGDLRKAMQQEAEMLFSHILHEGRSALELIDCNYAFLNDKLAKHYGVPDVSGTQMRRIDLPADSPRGGVLTLGAVLVVTSNPDRTSPVKRGLFILDNIIGSPPPPPPADVPLLEEAEKEFKDRQPTMREALELHRSKPLCSSCHSRMDPLGLGFENFNAMGMWREKERGQPIETKGELVTGESFESVRDLKRTLVEKHQGDFYRCLTEKMLTYALGRGLSYYDVEAVDQIVDRLEQENGKLSVLIAGVIESPQFQKRRSQPAETTIQK